MQEEGNYLSERSILFYNPDRNFEYGATFQDNLGLPEKVKLSLKRPVLTDSNNVL
jgi:hypothetical protein